MTVQRKKDLGVLLVILVVLMALAFWGDYINVNLRYAREDVLNADVWRLLSGHIVHLSVIHGAMNAVGLGLSMLIVGGQLSTREWAFSGLVIALAISLLLLLFSPNVIWYVGFSGVLHGLLTLGLCLSVLAGDKLHALALLLLAIKITREQLPSFDIYQMEGVIGGAVVVDSHLYGALSGLLVFTWFSRGALKRVFKFGS